MNLLVDIGNSRIKWLQSESDGLSNLSAIEHRSTDFRAKLIQQWQLISKPEQFLIACVANSQIRDDLIDLACRLWPQIDVIQPVASQKQFGVGNAYRQPNQLGIDRWLALLAAHRYHPGNSVVVDCGTATTVDVIDRQGQHLGGLIAPGLITMQSALVSNTAQLRVCSSEIDVGLASETSEAIYSGCLWSIIGLIECTRRQYPLFDQVLLTGGDATVISKHLPRPFLIDDKLVFKGLALFSSAEG